MQEPSFFRPECAMHVRTRVAENSMGAVLEIVLTVVNLCSRSIRLRWIFKTLRSYNG